MIGYLSGKVIEKSENSAIILAGEVGYEVNLPTNVLSGLKSEQQTELWIYTHVREDIMALYGFSDKDSLNFYKQLLSVSGIGPKVALAIISSAPIEKLKDSIAKGDPALLSAVSGVGKKTAEKAVVELKSKMGNISGGSIFVDEGTEDVVSALNGLGFQRAEIAEGIRKLPANLETSEEKVKYLIKELGRKS